MIGVPHQHTGESVKAYVVPLPDRMITREQVMALCESRLARFKCPTVIEIAPSLPHTATGKIARGRLREDA